MRSSRLVALLSVATLVACGSGGDAGDAGLSDGGPTDSGVDVTVSDGGSDGATSSDAQADASDAGDGGQTDAGQATYNDVTDSSLWSTFDTTTVDVGASGYWGTTFDGRYLYLVPTHNASAWDGIVTRYDTMATFTDKASWSTFDTQTVNANIGGFYGAAFDGQYVYFVPPASGPQSIVARYDSKASFTSAASWTTFDTSTVNAGAKGFVGATFDGRYLYLVPYYNGITSYSGIVARYDTKASFTTAGSWSTFDTSTVDANAAGFFGGVFDGKYVYLVPEANGTSGTVARYDTTASFTAKASWSTFDLTSVDASAKGFNGGGFDGRYVYFVPNHNGGGSDGVIARYDTTGSFGTAASWSTFDLTTVDPNAKGFMFAGFDGRYLYLSPHYASTWSGLLARYDTQASFTATSSWTTFDVSAVNSGAKGFQGAAFDGEYLYLVPYYNAGGYSGVVARFDAKSPRSMPALPAFSGSFF